MYVNIYIAVQRPANYNCVQVETHDHPIRSALFSARTMQVAIVVAGVIWSSTVPELGQAISSLLVALSLACIYSLCPRLRTGKSRWDCFAFAVCVLLASVYALYECFQGRGIGLETPKRSLEYVCISNL
jgi:hypothetical protein